MKEEKRQRILEEVKEKYNNEFNTESADFLSSKGMKVDEIARYFGVRIIDVFNTVSLYEYVELLVREEKIPNIWYNETLEYYFGKEWLESKGDMQ